MGHNIALRGVGRDEFPSDTKFGGVEYSIYCDVIDEVVGFAMKHWGFTSALLRKYPHIRTENVITITKDYGKMADSLSEYLGVEKTKIMQALDCLVLSSENCSYHSRDADPPPPLIKLADNTTIQSIMGCCSVPFYFLHRELKRRYERDYFFAVNQREKLFREQLYALFPENHFVRINKAVCIGSEGNKTDLDAVIFDSNARTLALFQLKWQDIFGNSLKERYSRITNFFPKTREWIDKVELWLNSRSNESISTLFGTDITVNFDKVILFIVNRNHVNFTDIKPDERAVWSTWYTFLKRIPLYPKVLLIISQSCIG